MLAIVALVLGAVVLTCLCGFVINTLFFQSNCAQYDVDSLALSLANKINASDRVGQLNELVESSRELVYVSSDNLALSKQEELPLLDGLCFQLLDEARQGATLVEQERVNQIKTIHRQLEDSARTYNARVRGRSSGFSLPWLQSDQPLIERIDVGRLKTVQSNVKSESAIPELARHDRAEGYVTPTSNLFHADIDARLPDSQADLPFKFSSLPACVGGTAAPARNTNPEVFVRSATIFGGSKSSAEVPAHIPSAVQIFCSMDTRVAGKDEHRAAVRLVSTAASPGALGALDK